MSESYDHGRERAERHCTGTLLEFALGLGLFGGEAAEPVTEEGVLGAVRERVRRADLQVERDGAENEAAGREGERGGVCNDLDYWSGVHDALAQRWGLTSHTYNHVSIIRGSFGTSGCDRLAPDPYPFTSNDEWREAARGDGQSYGGEVARVWREAGETDAELCARAARVAAEMGQEDP